MKDKKSDTESFETTTAVCGSRPAHNQGIDKISIVVMQIERYKERFTHYPESLHVDTIYRTRWNRSWCKERSIRISGRPLGRPPSIAGLDKRVLRAKRKKAREDEGIRQAVEGAFGVLKSRYSLDCVYEKLRRTSEATIMVNMLVMNMEKFLKDLFAPLSDG